MTTKGVNLGICRPNVTIVIHEGIGILSNSTIQQMEQCQRQNTKERIIGMTIQTLTENYCTIY